MDSARLVELARPSRLVMDARQVHLPPGMAKLHDELGVEAMDRLAKLGP